LVLKIVGCIFCGKTIPTDWVLLIDHLMNYLMLNLVFFHLCLLIL